MGELGDYGDDLIPWFVEKRRVLDDTVIKRGTRLERCVVDVGAQLADVHLRDSVSVTLIDSDGCPSDAEAVPDDL